MSSFTAKQLRAIKWISERDRLRVQLSAYPTVYFRNEAGKGVKYSITTISDWYNAERDRVKRRNTQGLA